MMDKIYRAGVLPYRFEGSRIHFLLMQPADARYGGPEFQIAKGKIEEGETPEEAGLREAEEELGLIRDNITHFSLLGSFLGRTTIYTAEISDPTRFNEPHFETGATAWFTLEDFQMRGRPLHLSIIQEAVRSITRQRT